MSQLNLHINPPHKSTPPTPFVSPQLIPLLKKAKDTYLLWYQFYQIIPKTHRHSLGQKIDVLLVEIIEALTTANFLVRTEKLPYVRLAIRKVDTLKIFLMLLWETKSIDNKKYLTLSTHLHEIGRMLGGWYGQLQKQNSPTR